MLALKQLAEDNSLFRSYSGPIRQSSLINNPLFLQTLALKPIVFDFPYYKWIFLPLTHYISRTISQRIRLQDSIFFNLKKVFIDNSN